MNSGGVGTLNAPLVNYYEHGTFPTLNHAHTALFGAFGLLGIWLILISACAMSPLTDIRSASGAGSGRSGSTMVAWSCGSCSTSFRSAGHNSTRSMSMGLPMRVARSFTTRRYSCSGCAFRAMWSLRTRRAADGMGLPHQVTTTPAGFRRAFHPAFSGTGEGAAGGRP